MPKLNERIYIMQPLFKVYMRGNHSYIEDLMKEKGVFVLSLYFKSLLFYFVKGNQYGKFRLTGKEYEKTTGII